mmetsp:Transcript_69839/g.221240  ORF Transcript_69839/g.221240 Transcript_69839/m.221240 type:complete len:95 (+) Transcript_69839:204-488(+)
MMYWYYFLCTLGKRPRWKVVVTNGQIIQFVFSFCTFVPFLVAHFSSARGPGGGGCSGFEAVMFNAAFNAALLVLFVSFHRRSYSRGRAGRSKVA